MKKVLLIDDDQIMIELLKFFLGKEGEYKTFVAYDGLTGFSKIIADDYDLIICDIMLPHMTGLELIQKLNSEGIEIPFLMISSYGNEETVSKAKEMGVSQFLSKPFSKENLLEKVNEVIEG